MVKMADFVSAWIKNPNTFLVSIMHSNNETGTLQPIKEISDLIEKFCGDDKDITVLSSTSPSLYPTFFHVDASQSLGKVSLDVQKLKIDYLTIAGHKLYAPKGVGALFVSSSERVLSKGDKPEVGKEFAESVKSSFTCELPPFLRGAGQEHGKRASTENVAYAVALGMACEVANVKLGKAGKEISFAGNIEIVSHT